MMFNLIIFIVFDICKAVTNTFKLKLSVSFHSKQYTEEVVNSIYSVLQRIGETLIIFIINIPRSIPKSTDTQVTFELN